MPPSFPLHLISGEYRPLVTCPLHSRRIQLFSHWRITNQLKSIATVLSPFSSYSVSWIFPSTHIMYYDSPDEDYGYGSPYHYGK